MCQNNSTLFIAQSQFYSSSMELLREQKMQFHDQCVCEVCNCGQHQCHKPHLNKNYQTLQDRSAGHSSHPVPSHKRHFNYQPSPYNPGQPIKLLQEDPHHPQKRSASVFERNASSIMKNGSFEGGSSYQNSYKEFEGKFGDLRASMLKRKDMAFEGKFDGETHYNQSYVGKVSPLTRMVENKPSINLGDGRFEGVSTYNKNFNGVPSEVPGLIRKQDNITIGGLKLEDDTSYSLNYSGVRGMPAVKAKSRDSLKPTGDFSGLSTYTNNYLGAVGRPSDKVVMKGQIGLSEAKIDSETTYATNYDHKAGGRTKADRPRSRKDLLKNDNKDYNQMTSYAIQYKASIGNRPQKIIHPSEIVIGTSKQFQGQSLYNESYRDTNQPKQIAKAPLPNGVLPNGSFQGNSTYTNHYNELIGAPSQLIKHKDAVLNDGGFNGNSTYHQHFKGSSPKKNCPVSDLSPPADLKHIKYNAQLGVWV